MRNNKSEKRSRWRLSLDLILLGLNLLLLLGMIVSGYSQLIDPNRLSWLVSAGLTFPIFAILCIFFSIWWLLHRPDYIRYSVITLLLCVYPLRTYFPVNISRDVPKGGIKVMSYNVKGFCAGEADKNSKCRDILDYIGHSHADILCLQESGCPPQHKMRHAIDSTLRRWAYRDSVRLKNGNEVTICSNYPLLRKQIILSPSPSYASIIYLVKMGKDTVAVVNNHFVSNAMQQTDKEKFKDVIIEPDKDSTKQNIHHLARKIDEAGKQRAIQADRIYAALKRLGDRPVIFCGDFNDSPLSYVHFRLTRLLNDTYTRSGNGCGISYHESGMYFRLDNILASRHWNAYGARVDNTIKASDHYPIYCWLKLRRD